MKNLHPSKDIVGAKSSELGGKRVALCITGGAAAYRCPDLARELMKRGAEVYAVMTEAASKLITPELMRWATGNPVVTELTGDIEHIALTTGDDKVDLVIVAPATANTISKAAHGICDNAVTTLIASALGSNIPVVFVPAMHASLYVSPGVQRSLEELRAMGGEVIEPWMEEGKAKMPDVSFIAERVAERLTRRGQFKGLKFLVTAGPTREPLDAVRFLTNPSSGKMGFALAEEAWRRGGEVTLIKGPVEHRAPHGVKVVDVVTTEDMYRAVEAELTNTGYDVVILAAAPLDYGFSSTFNHKLPSGLAELDVKLQPRPKISMAVRKLAPKAFFIGFKAEHGVSDEELIERAYARLLEAGMDLIVANDVGRESRGFSCDTNEVFIVDKERRVVHVSLRSKREVAKAILDVAAEKMGVGG